MSSKNPNIIGSDDDERIQAIKIVRECYEKKFGSNASAMAKWLGTSATNVENWCSDTTVPAWVIFKIFSRYDDLREFFFTGATVEEEPSRVRELKERIARLLKDKFMLDHLETQIGICEGFERQHQADIDRAHILHTLAKRGVDDDTIATINHEILKLFGDVSDPTLAVHDPQGAFGAPLPEKGSTAKGGAAASDRKSAAPRRKK